MNKIIARILAVIGFLMAFSGVVQADPPGFFISDTHPKWQYPEQGVVFGAYGCWYATGAPGSPRAPLVSVMISKLGYPAVSTPIWSGAATLGRAANIGTGGNLGGFQVHRTNETPSACNQTFGDDWEFLLTEPGSYYDVKFLATGRTASLAARRFYVGYIDDVYLFRASNSLKLWFSPVFGFTPFGQVTINIAGLIQVSKPVVYDAEEREWWAELGNQVATTIQANCQLFRGARQVNGDGNVIIPITIRGSNNLDTTGKPLFIGKITLDEWSGLCR